MIKELKIVKVALKTNCRENSHRKFYYERSSAIESSSDSPKQKESKSKTTSAQRKIVKEKKRKEEYKIKEVDRHGKEKLSRKSKR